MIANSAVNSLTDTVHYAIFFIDIWTIGECKGPLPPPPGSKLFSSHVVSAKIKFQNNTNLKVGAPHLRKILDPPLWTMLDTSQPIH